MKFFLLVPSLFLVFGAIRCQLAPNNTYNVPLLDFTDNPVNKSLLCSTSPCCPIALTFDDGPGGATDAIINYLRSNTIPGTFFMNTMNLVNVNTDLVAQQSIKNVVEYGFNLGTHTVHHKDLDTLSDADIKNEIVGVQTTFNAFMSPSLRLSLFRAPFGAPYDIGPQAQMNTISKIAADAGYFHVGGQIDPADYDCDNNVSCVIDPILRAVDEGRWGIIILHSIYQNTANALPDVIAGLRERKCEFFTVEQFIRAKYGKSSAAVMDDFNWKNQAPITTSSTFLIITLLFFMSFFYFWK